MLEITVILPPASDEVKLSSAVMRNKKNTAAWEALVGVIRHRVRGAGRESLELLLGILQLLAAARNPSRKGDFLCGRLHGACPSRGWEP